MEHTFERFFRSDNSGRDKYLSRLFGIFNEKLVKCWIDIPGSKYTDLGRPTLTAPGDKRGTTLDFTLVDQSTRKKYVAEMKCWLEYDGYKYLKLTSAIQLEGLKNKAFLRFLQMAESPNTYGVSVAGKPTSVDGSILIWGSANDEGKRQVMERYGVTAVLSVEEMLNDLHARPIKNWTEFIEELKQWSNGLFDFLSQNAR